MIDAAWVRLMAAYNAEMNRRLYAAADRLDEAARIAPRGAFFGSIHATLSHLVWGDRSWMARFAGWPKPEGGIADSVRLHPDWAGLKAARIEIDAGIVAWAASLDPDWLRGDLGWFSGALGRHVERPVWVLVTHMFNHQTHHRGQVHAMLTASGQATGDTDLPFVLDFPLP